MWLEPFRALELVKHGRPANIDISSLVTIVTAGSQFAEKHLVQFKKILPGVLIHQCYGQTETSGVATMFNIKSAEDRFLLETRPNSVGRPMEGLLYKIVDTESGKNLGPHQPGHLLIKSKQLMNGYYEMDSSDTFDEGWLKTGDLMYYDEELCFFFVDRIKLLIRYKLWDIPAGILEKVLNAHPDIRKAVVIGVPHEEDVEHPKAIVILEENAKITPREIECYVNKRVSEQNSLKGGVMLVKEFPLTPSGKVKRNELKKIILKKLTV